ncbi:hypothetical protein HHK36_019128 [Tetracentron sinense]|uniref:Uncharacterized protein n=1 Tax=Tetracentron sinense TaxID=13715 RepID=A0A834YYQ3_TETSI|nr:hypothetical protein HHK36_019128 [Tetracentron sinense]
MDLSKRFVLLLLLLMIAAISQKARCAEARPLSLLPQERYTKMIATLGIVCKCCDGVGDECTTTWDASCSKLQCLPWKLV